LLQHSLDGYEVSGSHHANFKPAVNKQLYLGKPNYVLNNLISLVPTYQTGVKLKKKVIN